jgi:hypothetical protein
MPAKMLWSTWSARAWPLSVDEEAAFRHELGPAGPVFDRDDISFLVTALRCGATVETITEVAPGLEPARLAAAYDHLESLRRDGAEEFSTLLAMTGGRDDLPTLYLDAARLMPVAVGRLVSVHGTPEFERVRQRSLDQLRACRAAADELEEHLQRTGYGQFRRQLAIELHNPFGLGIWGHPYYLPRRVADLSPGRLRDLLGEGG